jgi:hypothetical protein
MEVLAHNQADHRSKHDAPSDQRYEQRAPEDDDDGVKIQQPNKNAARTPAETRGGHEQGASGAATA